MAKTGKAIGEIEAYVEYGKKHRRKWAVVPLKDLENWLDIVVTAAAELDPDNQPITDFRGFKKNKGLKR